jgi:hypothetical protein
MSKQLSIPAGVTRTRPTRLFVWVAIVATLIGCGASGAAGSARSSASTSAIATSALGERLSAIDQAIERWRAATDLADVHQAAEEARNLVVGPDGPDYGDADGDGNVSGANDAGLLPGLDGQPGIAQEIDGACIDRDVLGGSWDDARERWTVLETAIADWSPTNNTFPSLPSHPQRIVGWSTLALASSDLATAVEYGGHAHLHIDISNAAVTDCR